MKDRKKIEANRQRRMQRRGQRSQGGSAPRRRPDLLTGAIDASPVDNSIVRTFFIDCSRTFPPGTPSLEDAQRQLDRARASSTPVADLAMALVQVARAHLALSEPVRAAAFVSSALQLFSGQPAAFGDDEALCEWQGRLGFLESQLYMAQGRWPFLGQISYGDDFLKEAPMQHYPAFLLGYAGLGCTFSQDKEITVLQEAVAQLDEVKQWLRKETVNVLDLMIPVFRSKARMDRWSGYVSGPRLSDADEAALFDQPSKP